MKSSFLRGRGAVIALLTTLTLLLAGAGIFAGPMLIRGPQLLKVSPADGATNMNPQSELRLEFDQPLQASSLQAAIRLDPPAELAISSTDRVVTIRPQGGLNYASSYRLIIEPSLRNLLGRGMPQAQSIAFTTLPYVAVVGVTPAQGSTQIASAAPVTVEFNAAVVSAEQLARVANDPRLASELPQPLRAEPAAAGTGSWISPTRYSFAPTAGWNAATSYTLTLDPQITADGVARLEQPYSWSFQTAATVIARTRPFDQQSDVPADGEIEVQLARDVDSASAAQLFKLTVAKSDTPIAGTLRTEKTALFFKPNTPLARGTTYEASIAPGVRATSGATINQQALSWSFQVIDDLAVQQVIPPADARDISPNVNQIAVHFNHPVVALTTPSDQNSLPNPMSISPQLQGVGRWQDTSTFVFSPTVALDPATTYTISVAAGLKDQTAGELRQPFVWSFSTIAPSVAGSLPAAGERFFGPKDALTIVFNQAMNLDSLRSAISLQGPSGSVPGTLAVLSRRPDDPRLYFGENTAPAKGQYVSFTPATELERGAGYVLEVSTAARALNGSATLAQPYRIGFEVAPLPRLLSYKPENGVLQAVSEPIVLSFTTPMDWQSVEKNLKIEPQPGAVSSWFDQTILNVQVELAPETSYTVTLGTGARDPYAVALDAETTFSFTTAALEPSMSLAGSGSVMTYSSYSPVRVPMQTVNLQNLDYSLYKIERSKLAETIQISDDYDRWRSFQPGSESLISSSSLAPNAARNQTALTLVDLGMLDPGVYFFMARGAGVVERQIMVVSPVTLTVKRSAEQLFVWAVDLATAQPVANLPLQAISFDSYTAADSELRPIDLGQSDADGILKASYKPENPYGRVYLWSTGDGPFTLANTDWSDGIDPWSFALPASREQPNLVGNLNTDRPLYRPGDTVHIRGVVRLDNDAHYSLPQSNQSVVLSIFDAEATTIFSSTLPLSSFGSFSSDLPLPTSATVGQYIMQARLADDSNSPWTIYGSFNVAEYRKPVFEVEIKPDRPDALPGERLTATVTARYFAGGVLANAPLRWRLLAAPYYYAPDTVSGYQFEDLDDAYSFYHWFDSDPGRSSELISEGSGTTDAQGQFKLDLPAELGKNGRSQTMTFDIEISDIDGQVIASQATMQLHAASFYIGLRPQGYVAEAGKPQKLDLITLDPQGQPIGNRSLEIGIYSREWYSVREQASDGRFYFTSAYTDTLVQNLPATSDAQGRATISFTPPKGGSYRISATGKDDGGRTAKSSAFTWAYGGSVFWGVNDSNRIDLIADKTAYKPGESAKILVTAPYKNSQALVTIERGSVLEHRLIKLSGTTEMLDIPIKGDYAPNVYVSVLLITPPGLPGALDAPAAPDMRMGLVNLRVSTEQQELAISITADKTQTGPRDEVNYSIKATDSSGSGVATELSLALVDKAVLTLADDPNPSLKRSFYEKRPLGVFTAQSITVLADRVTLALSPGAKGGGGGFAGQGLLRRDFPDTAYWNAAVVTGADGTANVTITLPDNLTTWRMTARGITQATQVGEATTDIVATRPLLVRPLLPRFLTYGDSAELGAVVQNSTGNPIEATVSLEILGPDAQPAPIQLNDDAIKQVTVPANGQTLLRWKSQVTSAAAATIRMRVTGGGLEDALEKTLPIQRYATPEAVASAGQVLDTTVETIQAPQGGQRDGELALELLPSLGAGLRTGLSYLESFPYACTEQAVSAFLPNAVSYRLYKQLGTDDAALKADLEKNLATGLQRLNAMQNLDGGWGWWTNQKSDAYLSAYVIQGLGEAVKAGYGVDQGVLDRGIAFLKANLESGSQPEMPETSRLNTRAYILFVLGELGQPDRGRVVALYEQRGKLDSYGRAYLLMAFKGLGDNERSAALVAELMSSVIMRPGDAHWEESSIDYWTMSSDTRTTGLVLQALVRADPSNVLIPNAVRYLMGLREHGHWRTTQETAISLMAISEYMVTSGELKGDYSYRVALNNQKLSEGSIKPDNLETPINLQIKLSDLAQSADSQLAIQRQAAAGQTGDGRLYYTLRMRSYQDAASVKALDQGVNIRREYVLVNTDTLSPTGELTSQAKLGGLVQVRLIISLPENMPFFMAEDMLPAGLEPLDTSLKTTSAAAREPGLVEAGNQPGWWYFERTEMRDNRVALFASDLPRGTYVYTYLARAVTPGSFQTLPAIGMRTYAPEVFGRSDGALFTVTEP